MPLNPILDPLQQKQQKTLLPPNAQEYNGVNTQNAEIIYEAFTIYYRQGVNPKLEKTFKFRGTIKQARIRAIKHCDTMGYKFFYIRPFMVDLDEEELSYKKYLDQEEQFEDIPS